MKKLLTKLLLLVGSTTGVFAQKGSITGFVLDSTANKPVEFATVSLLKDSSPVSGTSADERGKFSFNKVNTGLYKIQISFVGYNTKTIDNVIVSPNQDLDLGVIKLSITAQTLGEVTVTEQKALFEEKADRLVYNAEKDMSVKGGDATEVLRKIPAISVDLEGNVQLRGSSNIKVLINNKPSSIVARSISDALKQIPADNIKQVEVITSPSAKYDAEGTAGIINIITKKNNLQGTNGSVTSNFGQWFNSQNGTLNHRMKKVGISANGGYNNWKNKQESDIFRNFTSTESAINQFQNQIITGRGQNGYANLTVDYDIDSLNRMSAGLNYYNGDNSNNFNIDFEERTQSIVNQYFNRYMKRTYDWTGATINLDYTKNFKKPKKEFNILTMYSFEGEDSDYLANQSNRNNSIYYREKGFNIANNKEGTIQIDFTNPLDSLSTLEIGTKAILRQISSDYRVSSAVDGSNDFRDIPALANVFDYAQEVVSGYLVYSRTTRSKWSINVGGRYEHTFLQGNFLSGTASFSNNYGNIIPNLSLSKKFKKEQQVRFSYSQRIQRPLFFYLNPYINQSDSKNQYGGNPYLKPELTHSAEANYNVSIKQTNINASFFVRQTNNAIEGVRTIDNEGVVKQIFQNVAQNSAYGLNLSVTTKLAKYWSVNTSFNTFYNVLSSAELQTRNESWMYRINLNSTIDFGKGFKAQLFGFYNSPRVALQGTYGGFGFYNIFIQKEILKKKGTIGFGYDNPFNEKISWSNQFTGANFDQTQDITIYRRGWRLNLKYEFGKMSTNQRQKKRISNDDKKAGESN